MSVKTILQEIDNEIADLTQARDVLASLNGSSGATPVVSTEKARFTAASRAKMAAAQKTRWAKYRASKGRTKTVKPVRIISAAARRKMAVAQKARWAAYRAKKGKKAA
jgi:hypothetical protein